MTRLSTLAGEIWTNVQKRKKASTLRSILATIFCFLIICLVYVTASYLIKRAVMFAQDIYGVDPQAEFTRNVWPAIIALFVAPSIATWVSLFLTDKLFRRWEEFYILMLLILFAIFGFVASLFGGLTFASFAVNFVAMIGFFIAIPQIFDRPS